MKYTLRYGTRVSFCALAELEDFEEQLIRQGTCGRRKGFKPGARVFFNGIEGFSDRILDFANLHACVSESIVEKDSHTART